MVKISVIGSGRVGSTAAFVILERGLCDEMVLVDIALERCEGEALDIRHALSAMKTRSKVLGTDDYSPTKDSDLIIITAGIPRKPGESRLDLSKKNIGITKEIVRDILKYNSDSLLMVVSNPVDVMTYVAQTSSGFPKKKVFGLGTALDTIRLRSMICEEFGVKNEEFDAFVIGEHGDTMVPVFSKLNEERFEQERLDKVFKDIVSGGGDVIRMKGGTWFAPAVAIADVVESIVKDQKRVIPLSAYSEEYGVYTGIPSIVSKEGIGAAELTYNDNERALFLRSVDTLKKELSRLGL
ncbi:MAG: malate dehydrogenase [Candidatus Hydrothermarchaeales archaeon]